MGSKLQTFFAEIQVWTWMKLKYKEKVARRNYQELITYFDAEIKKVDLEKKRLEQIKSNLHRVYYQYRKGISNK